MVVFYSPLTGDSIICNHGTPYCYRYPTANTDTYLDHGNDIRRRIELENPLSSLSGVQWSRDIFSRPQGVNQVTRNGQPIVRVNLLNPQETGMPQVLPEELSSVTLGSYQPGLVRSYVTNMR